MVLNFISELIFALSIVCEIFFHCSVNISSYVFNIFYLSFPLLREWKPFYLSLTLFYN